MADRIQLRRTKGWRIPDGAIVVARPSKWGNPFKVVRSPGDGWAVVLHGRVYRDNHTKPAALAAAVDLFSLHLGPMGSIEPDDINAWLLPLHGHDLACWCPLDQPCHADVLLELAND